MSVKPQPERPVIGPRANKPGRPALTAPQVAERRRAISDAALTLFLSEGYDAVSIRRVADRAGVTPKTLYNYFDSKLALLLSLWSEIFADVFAALEEVESGDGPLAHHSNVCTAYVQYWIKRPDHYRLVFMSGDVTQANVSTFIDQSNITDRFAKLTAPLASLAADAKPSVHERSELLICALHGIVHCHVTMTGHPWTPPGNLVDTLVRSIIGPLR